MDDVQQKLFAGGIAVMGRHGLGPLGTGDHFALQAAAGPLQHEAEDVGGLVVAEVAAVHLADRAVVDDRQADLALRHALVPEHRAHGAAKASAINAEQALAVGDRDADHAVLVSGYLTRPW